MSEDKASHWRSAARKARIAAESMRDPSAKATMLRIAALYETMATKAESEEKGGQTPRTSDDSAPAI